MEKVPPGIIFIPTGTLATRSGSAGKLQNIPKTIGVNSKIARAAFNIIKLL
jgi:hypothetical protein